MNIGSRVQTPQGEGTLKRFVIDERWSFGRPDVIRWAAVQLDGKAYPQMFHPAHVQEVTVNEEPTTSGVLIQPLDEAVPAPEPEPEPTPDPTEPEPEGEEADEKLEELIEFPE